MNKILILTSYNGPGDLDNQTTDVDRGFNSYHKVMNHLPCDDTTHVSQHIAQ